MRRLLCAGLALLLWTACAMAITVYGSFPAPNSENFTTRDTLRIWFNAPPTPNVQVAIQGGNAAYPVAFRGVSGDTLLIVPRHFWNVGDHITVTVYGQSVTNYEFSFNIAVPYPSDEMGPYIGTLRYGHFPRSMAAADFDNDGYLDLVILYTDLLGVARNTHQNPFYDPYRLTWTDGGHSPCDAPRVVHVADLDGDGKPDIVTSDPLRHQVSIYQNLSVPDTIRFGDPLTINLPMTGPTDFKIADVTGDGLPDIVLIGRSDQYPPSRLYVMINVGGLAFNTQFWYVGLDPAALDIGDFDHDGRLDIVVACRGDRTVEMFNNASLSPLNFRRHTVIDSLPAGPDGIMVDNIYPCWDNPDDQQKPDLVVWSRGVHSYLQRGDQRTLDEDPFVGRFCAINDSVFSAPHSVPITGVPLSVTLAAFTPNSGHPSKDWIVIQQGDTMIHTFDAQLNVANPITVVQNAVSSMMFDVDLDGDLDFFFISLGGNASGDEDIVYLYSPPIEQHPTLDFGTVPITGRTRTGQFTYWNDGAYPVIVSSVEIPFTDNVYSYISPALPETLQPGGNIILTYGFCPLDSNWYGPRESHIIHSGGSGTMADTIMLVGIGGRSVLQTVPNSGQARTFTIDLGTVEPGAIDTTVFFLSNDGNYPLHVAYQDSALVRFALLDSAIDTVAIHSVSPRPSRVRIAAPASEGNYHENLIIYDSTFFRADGFGPRNRLVRDTVICALQIRVIQNHLPQFSFDPVSPVENGSGTIRVHVTDPDNLRGQDSLQVEYYGTTPAGVRLVTEPPNFSITWLDTAFTLNYHVEQNVPPAGQMVGLMFRAWDYQFPARWRDTTWNVRVTDLDDPPHIQPHDTSLVINESDLAVVDLNIFDEEFEVFDVRSFGKPITAQDTFNVLQGQYHFQWQPGYNDAGVYHILVTARERLHPALADSAHINITVNDLAPDLQATDFRVDPSTVSKGDPVTMHYTFREQTGVPVYTPFVIQLRDSIPGSSIVMISRDYSSLPANAVVSGSYSYVVHACGTHYFIFQIIPYGPDRDVNNNTLYSLVTTRCPDVVAGAIITPVALHKNEQATIQVSLEERNGVPLDTSFTAVLRVYAAGTMRNIAVFPLPSLSAHGRSVHTVGWAPDTCNEHRFEFEVIPPADWDADPTNNMSTKSLNVQCDPFRVYPRPFTPNNDGFNDTLYFAFGDNKLSSPAVNIYTLDGRLVATERGVNTVVNGVFWLGRDRYGKDCAPGAYLYVMQDGDRKVASGLIYLAR